MAKIVEQLTNHGNDNRVIPTITPDNGPTINAGAVSITPDTPAQAGPISIASEGRRSHQFRTAGKNNKGITRQPLDLSQLPKEIDENVKESIQSEILKPGGDFDKMIERKKREMEEDLAREGFAEELAEGARKISGAGATLPAGTNEIIADAGAYSGNDEDDFDDTTEDDFGEEVEESEQYDLDDAEVVDIGYDGDDLTDDEEGFEEDDQTSEDDFGEDVTTVEDEQPEAEPKAPVAKKPVPKKEEVISVDEYSDDFGDAGSVDEEVEIYEEEENTATTEEDTEEEREMRTQYLKEEITKKLRPVSERLDISGFAVAKRGTKTTKNINRSVGLAKWPLINTGIVITTKAIAGSMLELIRAHISNNDTRAALHIMYDHIVSAKPMSFNAWAKTIDAEDLDHLFFAFYISAFKGVNYIPIDCHNKDCPRKVFITEDIPFIKMVNFHTKENKAKFDKVYREEPQGSESGDTVQYRFALSNEIAVDVRRSTLYSEYVEMQYLNEAFIKKYADVINYMKNIEELYTIDNGRLIPIDYKIDPANEGKTIVNKIKAYANVIRTLTSDEIAVLDAHIAKLNEGTVNITYQRPAATCTICGEEIEASEMSAAALVFIRNQLGLLTII